MKVAWLHESDETNPVDAAVDAASVMQKPNTSRYFEVTREDGERWAVDLNEPEIRQVTPLDKETPKMTGPTTIKHTLDGMEGGPSVEAVVTLGLRGFNIAIEGYENPDGGPVITVVMKLAHPVVIVHRSCNKIHGGVQTEQLDLRTCHVSNRNTGFDFLARTGRLQQLDPEKVGELAQETTGYPQEKIDNMTTHDLINLILEWEKDKHEEAKCRR
jgi:hypothetical protein